MWPRTCPVRPLRQGLRSVRAALLRRTPRGRSTSKAFFYASSSSPGRLTASSSIRWWWAPAETALVVKTRPAGTRWSFVPLVSSRNGTPAKTITRTPGDNTQQCRIVLPSCFRAARARARTEQFPVTARPFNNKYSLYLCCFGIYKWFRCCVYAGSRKTLWVILQGARWLAG